VSKLIKCLLKILYQIQGANLPCWNQKFLTYLLWDQLPLVPAPSYPSKAIHPTQSKVLSTKDRDDIRPQTTKHYWCGSSRLKLPLHWKSDKKDLPEIKVIQNYLNPFSSIVRSLATPQRHIITSPDTHRHWRPEADPASVIRSGAISVIFTSQVSWLRYCKRDEVLLTTILWQNSGRQNGLISRIISLISLFSDFYEIMLNKVIFIGFRGAIAPIASSWIRSYWRQIFLGTSHATVSCSAGA